LSTWKKNPDKVLIKNNINNINNINVFQKINYNRHWKKKITTYVNIRNKKFSSPLPKTNPDNIS